MADPPRTSAAIRDDEIVHIIVSCNHHSNSDGRPAETWSVMDEEGWFSSHDVALARVTQLNTRLDELHRQADARKRREHSAAERAARQEAKEVAVLAAAGIKKRAVKQPGAYQPLSRASFLASLHSYTEYTVKAVKRSEHDVPAQQGG